MNRLDQELMAEAIDRLPPDQRTVVNGLFYERLSYRELALLLGCSVFHVDTLKREACDSLRDLIERATDD